MTVLETVKAIGLMLIGIGVILFAAGKAIGQHREDKEA